MRLFLAALSAMVTLQACTAPNTSIQTLQFSNDVESLPDDYALRAAKAVENHPIENGVTASFTAPKNIAGTTVFSPKRWYVCAVGLAPQGTKSKKTKPILSLVQEWASPPLSSGRYDVIVFFSKGHPSVIKSFDSPLCDTDASR